MKSLIILAALATTAYSGVVRFEPTEAEMAAAHERYELYKAGKLNTKDESWGPYHEGDILGYPDEESARTGLVDTRYRWPNGFVAWEYDRGLPSSSYRVIEEAQKEINSATQGCINFIPRTTERDFINYELYDANSCSSYVGMIGGGQRMNIGWCDTYPDNLYNVVHEHLHALGFHHMHTAWDRDNYVIIEWDNIVTGEYFY